MVAYEAAAAALADICCLAAGGAGRQYRVGFIIMRQSLGHSSNMSISAIAALLNRIAGAGAGRSHVKAGVIMLALGTRFNLAQTAARADVQNLAVNLAGSFPNYNLLHSVA